jgi:hypothetical protein
VTKAEIERRLKAAGAYYLCDLDDLHEVWVTYWGMEFTVRCAGPYGTLDEKDLLAIEFDILSSKP